MLEHQKLYRVSQVALWKTTYYLFKTDKFDPRVTSTHIDALPFEVIPENSIVFFVRHGRFRYINVIYGHLIGFLWIPENIGTHTFLYPLQDNEL
jgi:hypothetical protein